jgi:hypothetical protein
VVEKQAGENLERGIVKHIEVGREMAGFTGLTPQQSLEKLKMVRQLLESHQQTLKIEVGMFIGPDGKPIEGAV